VYYSLLEVSDFEVSNKNLKAQACVSVMV